MHSSVSLEAMWRIEHWQTFELVATETSAKINKLSENSVIIEVKFLLSIKKISDAGVAKSN